MSEPSVRRSWRPALPGALVLALAALLTWSDRATTSGIVAATLAAGLAGWIGGRLSATRLRGGVVPLLALSGLLLGWAVLALLAAILTPTRGDWPERLATGLDATRIALITAAVAIVINHAAQRSSWARPLPALALVAIIAQRLAAHRGGAIHLPHMVSDPAWLHGWNPAVAIAAIGAATGLLAAMALVRAGRSRRGAWHLLWLSLLAALFFLIAPAVGLFALRTEDPLGLAGKAPEELPQRQHLGRSGGVGPGTPTAGSEDPLGLAPRGDGHGGDEMVPFRDEYSTSGAQAPVAVVALHDETTSRRPVLYFRQVAFSIFNGRRLVRSLDPRMDRDLFDSFPGATPLRQDSHDTNQFGRVRVPTTVSLLRDHSLPLALTDAIELRAAPNPDPSLFRRAYAADAALLIADPEELLSARLDPPAWPETVRQAYLQQPDDPRYAQLAQEIVESIRPEYRGHPYARALAIAHWLSTHTKYSLRSKHSAAADPTADYLFGDRIGYCVHLAHASAYLLRALGVPARVAAGYAYTEGNRAGGSALLLRSGDAHAWAEGFFAGYGWVPIDPSPPSLDPVLPSPDVDLQRLLGEMARPKAGGHQALSGERGRLPTVGELVWLAVLLLCGFALTGYLIKLWRRWSPQLIRRDHAARRAYRAALDRLADAGWIRLRGETREAFAVRVASASPAFVVLTHSHLAAHFGQRRIDSGQAARLARDVARDLARTQRQRFRYLWHPYNWMMSR